MLQSILNVFLAIITGVLFLSIVGIPLALIIAVLTSKTPVDERLEELQETYLKNQKQTA